MCTRSLSVCLARIQIYTHKFTSLERPVVIAYSVPVFHFGHHPQSTSTFRFSGLHAVSKAEPPARTERPTDRPLDLCASIQHPASRIASSPLQLCYSCHIAAAPRFGRFVHNSVCHAHARAPRVAKTQVYYYTLWIYKVKRILHHTSTHSHTSATFTIPHYTCTLYTTAQRMARAYDLT